MSDESALAGCVIFRLEPGESGPPGHEWADGPLPLDRPYLAEDKRTEFYADPMAVEALLQKGRRWSWANTEQDDGRLVIVGAEVVAHQDSSGAVGSWLVVHLKGNGRGAYSTLEGIGRVIRLHDWGRELLERTIPGWGETVQVSDLPRAASLLAARWPEAGSRRTTRWPDQDPVSGVLTDLLVLRHDQSVQVTRPFDPGIDRPTPSYAVAGSGDAIGLVRLRTSGQLDAAKVSSLWLDAFLVELVQYERVSGLWKQVRDLAVAGKPGQWRTAAAEFRKLRSTELASASTDHPVEAAIARRLRHELRTDELIGRIQRELDDHNEALRNSAAERMSWALLGLTVATVILPLVLQYSRRPGDWAHLLSWGLGGTLVLLVVVVVVGPWLPGIRDMPFASSKKLASRKPSGR